MNIPVVPVGEAQGIATGATQAITAGNVTGTPHDDFAVTFGATLRQSAQQGNALLQKGDANESQNGKPAVGSGKKTGADMEALGLRTVQGTVNVLKANDPATSNSKDAIQVQASNADETDAKATLHNAFTALVGSGAQAELLSKAPNVGGAGTVPQAGTGVRTTVAKPVPAANPNTTATSAKTSSTLEETSSNSSFLSNALFEEIAKSDTTQQSLAGLLGQKISLIDNRGVVDVTLPNNQATAASDELKDGLAEGIKALHGVKVPAEVPTQTVSTKSIVSTGTTAKISTPKSATKAGLESASAGVVNAVKTNAVEITMSLNANAAIPQLLSTSESVTATPNLIATNPAPSILSEVAETRVNGAQITSHDGTVSAPALKGGTNPGAAFQVAIPAASTTQAVAPVAVQAAHTTSLAGQSTASGPVLDGADRAVKSVQTPNAKSTPAEPSTATQSIIFDISLKNATPTTAISQVEPRLKEARESVEQSASTPAKPVIEQPIAAEVASGTDASKTATGRPLLQGTLEHIKQPVEDPIKPPLLQSEICSAATANGHASSIAPVIVNDAVSTIQAGSGVQTTAASNAIALPHIATGTAGSAISESSSSVVSSLDAARHTTTAAALPAEPYRTISATPTALEVGVPDGTQGWLRIRAEVGDQGGVNASLAAGSNAGQEMLHRQLPALNAYLHSEQISVTTSVADRVFAAAGSNLAGMSAGSDGAGPDTSGRSTHQDLTGQGALAMSTGNQGGGAPGNGGQRDGFATLEPVHGNDSAPSYDKRTGVSDPVVAQTSRNGESGRWLNVRA